MNNRNKTHPQPLPQAGGGQHRVSGRRKHALPLAGGPRDLLSAAKLVAAGWACAALAIANPAFAQGDEVLLQFDDRLDFSPITVIATQKPRLVDPLGRLYARLCNFTGQPDLSA